MGRERDEKPWRRDEDLGGPGPAGLRFIVPWAAFGLAVLVASGAGLERMALKNFSVCPAYYPPPHQAQMKSLLEGAQAQPVAPGQYLVTQAKLQTFRENGERELLVAAPECVYNSDRRTVSSPGALRLQTADGKFSIEGEGFLWQQTNSSLALSNGASLSISNRVHSRVHPDLLANPPGEKNPKPGDAQDAGLEIFSDQFDYAAASGQGLYRRNVHVTGTNLNLTAGLLTFEVPMRLRQLQRVTAEQTVVADYEGTHATGEHATYSANTGLLEVSGRPAWQAGEREGRGDELTIDPTNRILRATGHAFLKMPGQGLGVARLLPSPNSPASVSSTPPRSFVEILCSNYELRTNRAVFDDQVRLRELAGTELSGKMSCARMTVTYVGTNQLERMVADHQVVIERDEQRLTSAKAVYTATNDLLELTGSPAWQAGARQGKGDLIRINTQRQEMWVTGHATMRLPSAEMGQMATLGLATNSPGPTSQFANISSDVYSLERDTVRFSGDVRIEHPRTTWTCAQMTVQLPPTGGRVQGIVAEKGVNFDLLDANAQKIHGTGERAVYTYAVTGTTTNELIQLTGSPALTTTNGTFRGESLLLDCIRNTVSSPGRYELRGLAPTPNTNRLVWTGSKPKNRPKK